MMHFETLRSSSGSDSDKADLYSNTISDKCVEVDTVDDRAFGDIEAGNHPPDMAEPSSMKEDLASPESTYYCQICFDNNDASVGYTLPCNHCYCKECLVNYLASKITDGKVYPACFYIDENPTESAHENTHENAEHTTEGALRKYKTCDAVIPPHIIESLLPSRPDVLEKYLRYKFAKENVNARECPYCSVWNIVSPEVLATAGGSKITCCNTDCNKVYCYYHANAHDFAVYPTCAEYDAAVAPVQQASVDLISVVSKQCPGCHIQVMKSGGCNHMKCQCGVAFCWLCGKQIDDSLFPAHFQWWNPSGCSNLQMNEATEPSTCSRVCARLLGIVQIIVLGPITLASTITSSLLCCSCIVLKLQMQPITVAAVQTYFSTCMSSWGIFWMIVLFFLPLALGGGAVAIGLMFAVLVITYPCYACIRMREGQYPWSDTITFFCRRRISPLCGPEGRLWRCFYRRVCCTHHTTTNITDPMHDQEQPTDSDHFKYRDSQDGLDIVTPSESQSGRQLGVDYTGSGGSGLPFVDLEGQQGGEGEGQEQDARRHAISNTTSDGGHEDGNGNGNDGDDNVNYDNSTSKGSALRGPHSGSYSRLSTRYSGSGLQDLRRQLDSYRPAPSTTLSAGNNSTITVSVECADGSHKASPVGVSSNISSVCNSSSDGVDGSSASVVVEQPLGDAGNTGRLRPSQVAYRVRP